MVPRKESPLKTDLKQYIIYICIETYDIWIYIIACNTYPILCNRSYKITLTNETIGFNTMTNTIQSDK